MPIRITLSRKKGWRMPPNTVKVCRPGKWGNPFFVGDGLHKTVEQCVDAYQRWIDDGTNYCSDLEPPSVELIQESLRGKNLACWCKAGSPCHADYLLKIANRSNSFDGRNDQDQP